MKLDYRLVFVVSAVGALVGVVACSDTSAAPAAEPDASVPEVRDAQSPLDGSAADASKAARCASSFGDELTAPFGRLDGTVLAIVKPSDQQCVMPNSDHVIVQVIAKGKVYRMVVNVLSTRGDPDVRYFAGPGPKMPGPAFAEGWHTGVTLDYAADLGRHNADFAATPMADLVTSIDRAIELDAKISVYGASSGGSYAHSAHKVHRNGNSQDGAMVLAPDSETPRYLLFHFAQQVF
jgi:hypothetical protein